MTRSIGRPAAVGTRPLLTRIPLYAGPLPAICPDRAPWPGETIRAGGVALHVRSTPGPEGRARIVYLHGLGGSSTNFTDVAGLLASELPGMALDLPGFGHSVPPAGFDYAPDSHAEVVAGFLHGLSPGPVHLVGNSMGGAVALIRAWLVAGPRSLWRVAAAVWAPALVIWGAADKVVSARKAPRTATALPRGRLFLLPRTGHVPQMERPGSVARAVLGMINSVNHYRW